MLRFIKNQTTIIMNSGQMVQDDYPNRKGCGLMTVMVLLVIVVLVVLI